MVAYDQVKKFFELDGPALLMDYSALRAAITEFDLRFDTIWERILDITKPTKVITPF